MPRIVAWEITRRCNLSCMHCRADAECIEYAGELSTAECLVQVDELVKLGKPTLILTGGEPLMRPDVWDIAEYAIGQGLRTVMAVNGTLLTPEVAARMAATGITRISISLDFPTAPDHDRFRGEPGAFESAVQGIRNAQAAGVEFQMNTTITRLNVACLDDMLDLALELGAVAFHPFLLVPTGRGKEMADQELSPEDYEHTLNWIYDRQKALEGRIFFKPTDAPHYFRILRQRTACGDGAIRVAPGGHSGHPTGHGSLSSLSRGCLAGIGFMFISHVGDVQGCGYLTVPAGNVREQPLSEIWHHSRLFHDLRQFDALTGKCGLCEFRRVCGGCRARAYEATGDYMAEEPYCVYQPAAGKVKNMEERAFLTKLQYEFPLTSRPFADLALALGQPAEEVVAQARALLDRGMLRSIRGLFDARRLGHQSVLVAVHVPAGDLEAVAQRVSAHPGVSHNYARRHHYNLWFTLTVPLADDVGQVAASLLDSVPRTDILLLPAIRFFKLDARFVLDEGPAPDTHGKRIPATAAATPLPCREPARFEPDPLDRQAIRLLGRDLPLVEQPFETLAAQAGLTEDVLLERARFYLQEGIMRRYGAVLNHRRAGLRANGMTGWTVPPERVEAVGQIFAGYSEVSHCYERPTYPGWPYNVFTMIHGATEPEVEAVVRRMAQAADLEEYAVLFSTVEFKKQPVSFYDDEPRMNIDIPPGD